MFELRQSHLATDVVEQRKQNYHLEELWDKLNLSQQFSVCSLGQFGYMLNYVRQINDRCLAILTLDDKVATINEEGLINVTPNISLRH
ncbi:hypothetical protein [Litorilituus sediminis]|uniref:Uncharacterized protein n=1 Tax=Litorilituus sediminis TaxID=718192 RepID=A0A4P6P8H7_9GAMM|nr:hypothetical protein [Litorilituus sediminis]QBG35767.1 hypothetical protein EMK97_08605 [Litorilituus sediminis]